MKIEIIPKTAKLECPRCNGKGYLEVTQSLMTNFRPWLREGTGKIRNQMRMLKKEGKLYGLTLREIGKLVDVKSPQQIKHHLLMLDKIGWNNFE